MPRQPVVSSNIKSIGLEGNVLEIEFTSGTVYQYTGETAAAHHAAMLTAESIGKYFGRFVRNDTRLVTKRVDQGAAA
jgi:isocitrate dehydrogenase